MTLKQLITPALLAAICLTLLPEPASAQRRAVQRVGPPRAVIVRGYAPAYWNPWFGAGVGAGFGGWYGGGWGPGWNAAWGPGWGPGWGGPGWFGPVGFGQGYLYNASSLRVQATPRDAEVYVDGYYAGTVDQFNGAFQRLRLEPGEHEIVIYADGYRAFRQRLYLQPSSTMTLRRTLVPLQAGEAEEPRPSPAVMPASATDPAQGPGRVLRVRPAVQTPVPGGSAGAAIETPVDGSAAFSVLSIRVQPAGAEVIIDGERWEGPGSDERLLVQVTPGPHEIEIRLEGYRTFTRTVDIGGGATETLNVSLSPQ